MISFLCSHCGAPSRVRPEQAGTVGKCPRCGKPVEAPSDGFTDPTTFQGNGTFEATTARDSELDFLAPPQNPDEIGRIGNYRVLKRLGQGGMGVVLLAEHLIMHRSVALKVMKKTQAQSGENRARFLREARTAAKLEHDNVVPIYDVAEDGGVPFIAMKLLVGETLDDRLNRDGILDEEVIVRVGKEIALGLGAAHDQGLIHRDVKPANVWLEADTGRVKILDFGLALACDEDVKLTQDNYLVGTPAYMSPEQAEGDRPLDARSDLFSLGGVLYRCATGELPFKGKNTLQVLTALATKHPPSPTELNPSLNEGVAAVIMNLLEKDPADRPKDARAVVSALEEARAPGGYEEVEEDEEIEEIQEIEEATTTQAKQQTKPRRGKKRRPPPARKKRDDETAEERLGRRVIWFGVFAAIGVFLLLAALVVRRTFFS